MKALFINPPLASRRKIWRNFDCSTESKGNYLYQPYDFLLLSARVPESWSLEIIDAIADDLSVETAHAEVQHIGADLIVLAMAETSWADDVQFLEVLRRQYPECLILVFGDILIEDSAVEAIEQMVDGILVSPFLVDFADFSGLSRAELAARRGDIGGLRTDDYYNRKDMKRPQELSLGLPRHERFMHPSYRWPFARHFKYTTIFTAWGCPYSCEYCILSRFPNIWRPFAEVIAEMQHVKKLGFKEIYIGDRSFGLPRGNVLDLLQRMISERFGFSWSSYFHPNQYDPELFDLMVDSGCHTVIIGVESADIEGLKKFKRHMRVDKFQNLLQHAKLRGVDVCADFIIGLPGETQVAIEDTVRFSKGLDIQYASFNIATPSPGSSIRRTAIEDGRISVGDHHYDSFGKANTLSSDQVPATELVYIRNRAVRQFYMRPSYLARRMMRIRSWQHFMIQAGEAVQIFKRSA
jgi:anaerobic magnesium-protoporphyrin IX monomethyl ester cyclase